MKDLHASWHRACEKADSPLKMNPLLRGEKGPNYWGMGRFSSTEAHRECKTVTMPG